VVFNGFFNHLHKTFLDNIYPSRRQMNGGVRLFINRFYQVAVERKGFAVYFCQHNHVSLPTSLWVLQPVRAKVSARTGRVFAFGANAIEKVSA
jgi:hypothetical protein